MKKNILFFLVYLCCFLYSKAQTPYTTKITNCSSGIYTSTNAHICPVNLDSATIQATAGWPFGAGYKSITDLHVLVNQTYTISCGAIVDYNTIQIDSGGVLEIMPGNGWTYLGCKGSFILNGTILGGGTYSTGLNTLYKTYLVSDTGTLSGDTTSWTFMQGGGGNGGTGSAAYDYPGTPNYSTTNPGGNANYGNGGGGSGGGGTGFNGGGGTGFFPGYVGGDATDSTSGYGGQGNSGWGDQPSSVKIYAQNGNTSSDQTNNKTSSYVPGSSGGSGGTRGIHGSLIYIKALSGITGKGTIDVRGENGGNGGASGNAYDSHGGYFYSNSLYGGLGGGGGGGAGGDGGFVLLNYAGTLSSVSILTQGGKGGLGGKSCADCDTTQSEPYGQNGNAGANGAPGNYQSKNINSFAYQWRNNYANIAGATANIFYAKAAGHYDCKIKDPKGNFHITSDPAGFNTDTVVSDGSPIAVIKSANPSLVSCVGDTITLTAQYTSGQTYLWLKNGTAIPGATGISYKATLNGNYQVRTGNTCSYANSPSDSLVFNTPPSSPTIITSGATTFCQGDSVKLTSSDVTGNIWNTGANTKSIIVKANGVYTVTYTDVHGCSATKDTTVTVKPASVNAGHDTAITCGNNIQLNAVCNPPLPTSIVWNPPTYLSNATIVNPICSPTTAITYTITATLNNGCSAADVIKIMNNPVSDVQICLVTVDTASLHNIIVWDKTGMSRIDSFKLYFYNSANKWQLIKEVPFSAPNYLVDSTPINNPNANTVRYCLTALDSCGTEETIGASPWQNTCHINQAPAGTFTWGGTGYLKQGVTEPVATYYLLRDSISNGNWKTVDSTNGFQNTMSDAVFQANPGNYPLVRWCVSMILSDSVNTGCIEPLLRPIHAATSTSSRSNTQHNGTITSTLSSASDLNNISVYPNPATNTITISTHGLKMREIKISDMLGKEVYGNTFSRYINISNLPSGMYILSGTGENGNVYHQKIVKQ